MIRKKELAEVIVAHQNRLDNIESTLSEVLDDLVKLLASSLGITDIANVSHIKIKTKPGHPAKVKVQTPNKKRGRGRPRKEEKGKA